MRKLNTEDLVRNFYTYFKRYDFSLLSPDALSQAYYYKAKVSKLIKGHEIELNLTQKLDIFDGLAYKQMGSVSLVEEILD